MSNKNVFSANLRRYMEEAGKSRREVSESLGISYYTLSDWVNGKKYPRMDKVEILANYFGIKKSDLIEDKQIEDEKKKTDVAVDIVYRLNSDEAFLEAVKLLDSMEPEQLNGVLVMLRSLLSK